MEKTPTADNAPPPPDSTSRSAARKEKLRKFAKEKRRGAAKSYGKKLISASLLVIVALVVLYSGYRKVLFIPESGEAFRVRNYSLGTQEEAPFYQTARELELEAKMAELRDSTAMQALSKAYYDQYLSHFARGRALTQTLRLGPTQLPEIYAAAVDACELLGVEKVPNIYLTNSAGTRLQVTNRLNPTIRISSDFTWAFKPEELRFLLARQVAHIRLNHVFYLDMLDGLRGMGGGFLSKLLSKALLRQSVGATLLEWCKEAEISADRAALVVTGDVDVALRALVKLNIGANYEDTYSPVNIDDYIRQVEELEDHRIEAASAAIHELENPNPFLTVRARHLKRWYEENATIFK